MHLCPQRKRVRDPARRIVGRRWFVGPRSQRNLPPEEHHQLPGEFRRQADDEWVVDKFMLRPLLTVVTPWSANRETATHMTILDLVINDEVIMIIK
jgi:hypothetical protein